MQNRFDAKLQATFGNADKYRNVVEQIKKQSQDDPEGLAVRIAAAVPYQMEQWRQEAAKLFNVDIADRESVEGFKPRTIAEAQVFCHLADRYEVFSQCLWVIEAYIEHPSLVGRAFAEKVCEEGLRTAQRLPALIAHQFHVFRKRLDKLGASTELLQVLKDQEAQWLAGYLATQISFRNQRLAKAIDNIREHSPERSSKREWFETLLRELYVEAPEVWNENYLTGGQLLAVRSAVVKKIEARNAVPPEELQLAEFAEREVILRRSREAKLTPQEFQVYKLFTENPKIKYREVAEKLNISVSQVGVLKHRIKRALDAA